MSVSLRRFVRNATVLELTSGILAFPPYITDKVDVIFEEKQTLSGSLIKVSTCLSPMNLLPWLLQALSVKLATASQCNKTQNNYNVFPRLPNNNVPFHFIISEPTYI